MLDRILLSILIVSQFLLNAFANEELNKLTPQLILKNVKVYNQSYITGGQPTITDLEKIAASNIKVVINLRAEDEFSLFDEQKVVERLGMKYINLPISSAQDINEDNIKRFHHILDEQRGNALIHCASGNRVGALFALEAFTYGKKSPKDALIIGQKTGMTRLEKHVKELMQATK